MKIHSASSFSFLSAQKRNFESREVNFGQVIALFVMQKREKSKSDVRMNDVSWWRDEKLECERNYSLADAELIVNEKSLEKVQWQNTQVRLQLELLSFFIKVCQESHESLFAWRDFSGLSEVWLKFLTKNRPSLAQGLKFLERT